MLTCPHSLLGEGAEHEVGLQQLLQMLSLHKVQPGIRQSSRWQQPSCSRSEVPHPRPCSRLEADHAYQTSQGALVAC